jgi:hypothetical protein
MADDKGIECRLLPRASLQFRQRTALWHNSLNTNVVPLPNIQATIFAHTLQLEAFPDSIKLSIEPFFHAELNVIYNFRIESALGRVEESLAGLR